MATIKRPITLGHRANLGEDAEQIEFAAGQTVNVLQEWAESALCKDDEGRLFNIPKSVLEG